MESSAAGQSEGYSWSPSDAAAQEIAQEYSNQWHILEQLRSSVAAVDPAETNKQQNKTVTPGNSSENETEETRAGHTEWFILPDATSCGHSDAESDSALGISDLRNEPGSSHSSNKNTPNTSAMTNKQTKDSLNEANPYQDQWQVLEELKASVKAMQWNSSHSSNSSSDQSRHFNPLRLNSSSQGDFNEPHKRASTSGVNITGGSVSSFGESKDESCFRTGVTSHALTAVGSNSLGSTSFPMQYTLNGEHQSISQPHLYQGIYKGSEAYFKQNTSSDLSFESENLGFVDLPNRPATIGNGASEAATYPFGLTAIPPQTVDIPAVNTSQTLVSKSQNANNTSIGPILLLAETNSEAVLSKAPMSARKRLQPDGRDGPDVVPVMPQVVQAGTLVSYSVGGGSSNNTSASTPQPSADSSGFDSFMSINASQVGHVGESVTSGQQTTGVTPEHRNATGIVSDGSQVDNTYTQHLISWTQSLTDDSQHSGFDINADQHLIGSQVPSSAPLQHTVSSADAFHGSSFTGNHSLSQRASLSSDFQQGKSGTRNVTQEELRDAVMERIEAHTDISGLSTYNRMNSYKEHPLLTDTNIPHEDVETRGTSGRYTGNGQKSESVTAVPARPLQSYTGLDDIDVTTCDVETRQYQTSISYTAATQTNLTTPAVASPVSALLDQQATTNTSYSTLLDRKTPSYGYPVSSAQDGVHTSGPTWTSKEVLSRPPVNSDPPWTYEETLPWTSQADSRLGPTLGHQKELLPRPSALENLRSGLLEDEEASPVSKLLGPSFKATQRYLSKLKQRRSESSIGSDHSSEKDSVRNVKDFGYQPAYEVSCKKDSAPEDFSSNSLSGESYESGKYESKQAWAIQDVSRRNANEHSGSSRLVDEQSRREPSINQHPLKRQAPRTSRDISSNSVVTHTAHSSLSHLNSSENNVITRFGGGKPSDYTQYSLPNSLPIGAGSINSQLTTTLNQQHRRQTSPDSLPIRASFMNSRLTSKLDQQHRHQTSPDSLSTSASSMNSQLTSKLDQQHRHQTSPDSLPTSASSTNSQLTSKLDQQHRQQTSPDSLPTSASSTLDQQHRHQTSPDSLPTSASSTLDQQHRHQTSPDSLPISASSMNSQLTSKLDQQHRLSRFETPLTSLGPEQRTWGQSAGLNDVHDEAEDTDDLLSYEAVLEGDIKYFRNLNNREESSTKVNFHSSSLNSKTGVTPSHLSGDFSSINGSADRHQLKGIPVSVHSTGSDLPSSDEQTRKFHLLLGAGVVSPVSDSENFPETQEREVSSPDESELSSYPIEVQDIEENDVNPDYISSDRNTPTIESSSSSVCQLYIPIALRESVPAEHNSELTGNSSSTHGVYDIRYSSGPGSTNRRRKAMGLTPIPGRVSRPVDGVVYVSAESSPMYSSMQEELSTDNGSKDDDTLQSRHSGTGSQSSRELCDKHTAAPHRHRERRRTSSKDYDRSSSRYSEEEEAQRKRGQSKDQENGGRTGRASRGSSVHEAIDDYIGGRKLVQHGKYRQNNNTFKEGSVSDGSHSSKEYSTLNKTDLNEMWDRFQESLKASPQYKNKGSVCSHLSRFSALLSKPLHGITKNYETELKAAEHYRKPRSHSYASSSSDVSTESEQMNHGFHTQYAKNPALSRQIQLRKLLETVNIADVPTFPRLRHRDTTTTTATSSDTSEVSSREVFQFNLPNRGARKVSKTPVLVPSSQTRPRHVNQEKLKCICGVDPPIQSLPNDVNKEKQLYPRTQTRDVAVNVPSPKSSPKPARDKRRARRKDGFVDVGVQTKRESDEDSDGRPKAKPMNTAENKHKPHTKKGHTGDSSRQLSQDTSTPKEKERHIAGQNSPPSVYSYRSVDPNPSSGRNNFDSTDPSSLPGKSKGKHHKERPIASHNSPNTKTEAHHSSKTGTPVWLTNRHYSRPALNQSSPVRPAALRYDEQTVKTFSPPAAAPSSSMQKLSLQEAFYFAKPGFMKRSRARISRIDRNKNFRENGEVKGEERASKTEIAVSKPSVSQAPVHPKIERLHRPKPRQLSKKYMKTQNIKLYNNLPEVKAQKADDRRSAFYKSNRLRAKLFDKKVRDNLKKRYAA